MREDALYLLRIWRDGAHIEDWRASLENVRTRDLVNFASVDLLQSFLDQRTCRTTACGPTGGRVDEGETA